MTPESGKYSIRIDHSQGFAIGDGAKVVHYEGGAAAETPTPPAISVALLTHTVPTAYCHHLDATVFPFVTVKIDNTNDGCADTAVRIEATIEGYSDTVTASVQVKQGTTGQASLLPLLQPSAVATLNEIRPATLRITVRQTEPERVLCDQTERVLLHARNTALLALRAPGGGVIDLTQYLAAWVTPRAPEMERLLRRAAEYHPDRMLVGYHGASTLAQGAQIARQQAQAIFAVLQAETGFTYVNSPLTLGAESDQVTQRVRLPAEVLASAGSANCIDGTVLFASLLELAALDPILVLVPGHAFVGWRTWARVDRYEFLETTLIGYGDFDSAQASAQARYDDALMKGYFERELFDTAGYARLIDVAACRAQGIYPLM
ncbi:MAG: hypothetical protein ACM30E_10640 [Nitrososphaerales archaeon]